MKKLTMLLLSVSLIFMLTACGTRSLTGESTVLQDSLTPVTGESALTQDNLIPGTSGSGGLKGKLGFLAINMGIDFNIRMGAGIERAARENGYELTIYDYQFDAEKEIAGIETLMDSGVQAFYGIFLSTETAASKLKEYPGIGIISQAADMPAAQAFIINDYEALGNKFVESLDYFLEMNNLTSGDLACIWTDPCQVKDSTYYNAMMTVKGIIEKRYQGTDINYVADEFATDTEESANITVQLLNAHPKLKYVLVFNNDFAIAAANEIEASTSDTSKYFVFSTESDEEGLRLIASGSSPYRACASNEIEETGYQTGLQLINWVENGVMENVTVTKTLIDSRNINDYK